METVLFGFTSGMVAASAIAAGKMRALIGRSMSQRTGATMLGFAAAVMFYIISHEFPPETPTRTAPPLG